jgi:predicted GTPase
MIAVAAHGSRAPTSLAAFNRSLIQIAAGLSAVVQIAERVGSTTASDNARKALGHLEEGTFLIGVVGEFKRGKSTFINALLGQEILPADVLPATAVVSRIIYGRNASCTLTLSDGSELPIPFAEIANYVTKLTAQSAEQAQSVAEAIVAFPAMTLQNNIQIIDTPGLGDEAAMTERTMALLPTVDAAILVVSARSPFSSAEQALLRSLLHQLRLNRVFIVVNQIDLVANADVDRVTTAIAARAEAVAAESDLRGTIDIVPFPHCRHWMRSWRGNTTCSRGAALPASSRCSRNTSRGAKGLRRCSVPPTPWASRPKTF